MPIMVQKWERLHPDAIRESLDRASLTPEAYFALLDGQEKS